MNIRVENGSFHYDSTRTVLKNINFSADSGDLVAILGPNGAGKTTLLRCIMGFLKWNEGKSLVDNEDVRAIPQRKLWQKLSYVPQAKGVSSGFTAREMILLGRSSHLNLFSQPKAEDVKKAEDLMEQLHIPFLADKKCTEMSGGELQMVLIARALAAEPDILILDEPESNLDFKNQLIVLETMSKLTANGMTCIFNTHYPAHALQRANKSFILSKSGDYIFGDTHKVVTEDNIENAFGVKAVIGEIETPGNIFRNVVPLSVSNTAAGDFQDRQISDDRKIASITIITDDFEMSQKINMLFHEYNKYLIGRMGMPYRSCGVYIINATLDGPESKISELSAKLNLLPGVSVKTTFAKGEFDEVQ